MLTKYWYPLQQFRNVIIYDWCCVVIFVAVAGRCIPTLPNVSTIEDVIFNKTPIPIRVQDLVNGTTILAELLNARQVSYLPWLWFDWRLFDVPLCIRFRWWKGSFRISTIAGGTFWSDWPFPWSSRSCGSSSWGLSPELWSGCPSSPFWPCKHLASFKFMFHSHTSVNANGSGHADRMDNPKVSREKQGIKTTSRLRVTDQGWIRDGWCGVTCLI